MQNNQENDPILVEETLTNNDSLSFIQKLIFSKFYTSNKSKPDSHLSAIDLSLSDQKKRMSISYNKTFKKIKFLYNSFKKLFTFLFYLMIGGMIMFIIWALFMKDNITLKEFSTRDFNVMVPSGRQFVLNQKSTSNSRTYVWSKDSNFKLSYIKTYVYYYPQSANQKTIDSMINSFDNYFNADYLNKDMINNWKVKNVHVSNPQRDKNNERYAKYDVYDNDKIIGIQREKHIYLENKEIAIIVWSYNDEKQLVAKSDEIIKSFKN